MAKQLVNPIERHVEKLVLAVAGLLLIGVLMKFVFSSPNKVMLGNDPVTPGNIDARLAQKSNEVLEHIRNVKAPPTDHDPKFDEFAALVAPVKASELPLASAISPDIPMVDDPEVMKGGAQLVALPAPPKPVFVSGRNTVLANDARTAVDWVHLAIPFDVKGASELQRRAWGATLAKVIFATPELQRRALRADGSWSDDDWQSVQSSPSFKMPTPPTIRLSESGDGVVANKSDQQAAEKYRQEIAEPRTQLSILRPLPPNFSKDETAWKMPLVTTYEAVVKQDQEFLSPTNPNAPVEDRYGVAPTEGSRPKVEAKTPAQMLNQALEEARAQMEQGRKLWSKNEVTLAYNRALEISDDREGTADIKTKAQRLMKEAELLIVDIDRNPKGRPGAQPGGIAEAKVREPSPQQDIWAWDAAPGSIINGQTYQYRMRPRVLNGLAGIPESFKNPLDAQVMFVAGEWSAPTDPIHVPPDSWYFVTRENKNNREVGVEFFRWYDGVWIKSRAADFKEGMVLTHEERVAVPKHGNPEEAETPMVYFGEELALLDIEFSRPLRERKSGSTKEGVKFASQAEPTTTAVFVDKGGRLHERVVAVDKDDPTKKMKTYTPTKRASVP